jgi:hypothetical protein
MRSTSHARWSLMLPLGHRATALDIAECHERNARATYVCLRVVSTGVIVRPLAADMLYGCFDR